LTIYVSIFSYANKSSDQKSAKLNSFVSNFYQEKRSKILTNDFLEAIKNASKSENDELETEIVTLSEVIDAFSKIDSKLYFKISAEYFMKNEYLRQTESNMNLKAAAKYLRIANRFIKEKDKCLKKGMLNNCFKDQSINCENYKLTETGALVSHELSIDLEIETIAANFRKETTSFEQLVEPYCKLKLDSANTRPDELLISPELYQKIYSTKNGTTSSDDMIENLRFCANGRNGLDDFAEDFEKKLNKFKKYKNFSGVMSLYESSFKNEQDHCALSAEVTCRNIRKGYKSFFYILVYDDKKYESLSKKELLGRANTYTYTDEDKDFYDNAASTLAVCESLYYAGYKKWWSIDDRIRNQKLKPL
jgi:hypothetical protein